MQTNPNVKRILCYGDSLTRGRVPDKKDRYAGDKRRTAVLQSQLGSSYEIIEEGLRGRSVYGESPKFEGRNGLTYRYPCILSHLPLDLIIIMLGTNDMQTVLQHDIQDIVKAFGQYDEHLKHACNEFECHVPIVVLISPPYIDETILKKDGSFPQSSGVMSKELAAAYKQKSAELGWFHMDAGAILGAGVVDGVHLSGEQNRLLANALTVYLEAVFR